jgi:diaminopimelate decarboxylase
MELDYSLLKDVEKAQGGSFYLLDTEQFTQNFHELLNAFRSIYPNTYIAYSYKTNYIPRLCKLVDMLGGYAEIVSDMEYEITRRLGISTSKIHFNGPYKNAAITKEIILGGGIVNLDDYVEVPLVLQLAEEYPNKVIKIGLRCNFNINDGVTSRFGFDIEKDSFRDLISTLTAKENISIAGIQCHFATRAIETWQPRAEGISRISKEYFTDQPSHIDLGGGMFGKMKESLKEQFASRIPTYEEYAQQAAGFINSFFKDSSKQPDLFIEPGSALVGDAMRFVAPVISIKDIRGKAIATLLGSVYNINPTLNKKNPPITVFTEDTNKQSMYKNLDFGGYTCIEGDYLYKGYNGPLSLGDLVVFENVGSYSVVLKPPFILPNFPVVELCKGDVRVIKRKETFDDLFQTYVFQFNY